MRGLIALEGKDVIAAFMAGGFRVARRERGLALLTRGVQVVVVPETRVLSDVRIRALLERAEVEESDMLAWLAKSGVAARTSSGFRPRADSERPSAAPKNLVESLDESLVEERLMDGQDVLRRKA
jgi:hypothetical protein